MAGALKSIRLDMRLADEAVKVFGVKSRTEAVHVALREIVAMKHSGKGSFRDAGGRHRFARDSPPTPNH
jgi:Arc/MetJ family transcription regulator